MIYFKRLFFVFLTFCCIGEKVWACDSDQSEERSTTPPKSKKPKLAEQDESDEGTQLDDSSQYSTPHVNTSSSRTLTPGFITSPLSFSSSTATTSTSISSSPTTASIPRPENARAHYFEHLKTEYDTYHDSRSSHEALDLLGHPFKEWHKAQIEVLKKLTPLVRKALEYKGRGPTNGAKTNLLKYRMDLLVGKQKIPVIEPYSIWVSGWPSKYNQEKLKEAFTSRSFQFISSMIPYYDTLNDKEKGKALCNRLRIGYCLEKESILIQQRIDHQKSHLERAEKEIAHLNQMYLHTEQGLMLYLASNEVKEELRKALKKLPDDLEENPEITVVVNVSSSRSVCMNCADRLLRESEWGAGFLSSFEGIIREKVPQFKLKLHFFASAFEPYSDDLSKAPKLLSYYKNQNTCPRTEHANFGFLRNEINFCEALKNRVKFNSHKPLLGHAIL